MISAYIRRQRIVNGLLTGLMITAGLTMIAYASFNIVSDVRAEPEQKASFTAALEKRCQDGLSTLGFSAMKMGSGMIKARGYSLENPLEQLSSASIGIQQCAGYSLATFCMGAECTDGVINFELKPVEGSKR